MNCYSVSNMIFFPFCVFFLLFFKIVYVDLIFFNIELIMNLVLYFFFFKTLWIIVVFFHVIFWKIIFVDFFFNIKLVENYNYNKLKSYRKSVVVFLTQHCSFSHKTLSIAAIFFLMGFFPSKIIFVVFFLYIKLVENLAL